MSRFSSVTIHSATVTLLRVTESSSTAAAHTLLMMGAMTASTFNFCGSTLWELPCSSVESCGSTGRGCRLVGAWWSWAGAKVSESAPKPPTARTLAAAYAENSTRWTRRSQAINDIAHLLRALARLYGRWTIMWHNLGDFPLKALNLQDSDVDRSLACG